MRSNQGNTAVVRPLDSSIEPNHFDPSPMKLLDWRNPQWRKRFWTVLTLLLVFVLASHPELRLLIPLLDAIGLDVFLIVIGLQLSSFASSVFKPQLVRRWRWLVPAIRATHHTTLSIRPLRFARDFARYEVFYWTGDRGPRTWFRLHKLLRVARLGPVSSLQRASAA